MLTVCFAAKGGQGCSTVAAMLAVLNGAVIVDTAGDMPAVLGLPDPDGPGLTDALISGSPLHDIAQGVQDGGGIALLPRGNHGADDVPGHRWFELAEVLAGDARGWVLDAGIGPARIAAASADRALLVSRYCYLALRRAVHLTPRSTGLVTIREHGRSLDRHDLERLLRRPRGGRPPVGTGDRPRRRRRVARGPTPEGRPPGTRRARRHRRARRSRRGGRPMSAFVVGKAHIDALLTAGLVLPRHRGPLTWFWPEITPDEIRDADQRCTVGIYQERRHVLTEQTAGRVGAMLWAENQRSVNHRYDEDDWEEPFEFQPLPGNVLDGRVPVVVLKAIDCFDYQSCEHPEWERSEAKAFCDALRSAAIARLPGYEDAPAWEIDDREVFVKVTHATRSDR